MAIRGIVTTFFSPGSKFSRRDDPRFHSIPSIGKPLTDKLRYVPTARSISEIYTIAVEQERISNKHENKILRAVVFPSSEIQSQKISDIAKDISRCEIDD